MNMQHSAVVQAAIIFFEQIEIVERDRLTTPHRLRIHKMASGPTLVVILALVAVHVWAGGPHSTPQTRKVVISNIHPRYSTTG
jgi:hypothetical protein